MNKRSLMRDALLVAAPVLVGWWLRGPDATVLAQHSGSSSSARGGDSGLSFQLGGGNPQESLTIYNPGNRTLYVYPHVGTGNSHMTCQYMLRIDAPGGPIDRQNCAVGPLY